jgi:murein DD-endopeptidase MepM/ murein hydrolase activator NlpD
LVALAIKSSFCSLAFASLFLVFASSSALAEVSVSSVTPKQGEVIEVTVPGSPGAESGSAGSNSGSAGVSPASESGSEAVAPASHGAPHMVKFNGASMRLFANGKDANGLVPLKALIGIPADLKPGKYKLTCGADSLDIAVKDGKFPLQHLTLPPGKDNFIMSPGEKEAVEGAKATCSDKRLWRGVFQAPSKFRTSAAFGLKRVVNGKLLDDYFHSGLDFAAPMGSTIAACANGKVVLAHLGFRLHGNIVAIDHGQGVISFYLHMSKIAVKEGDEVKACQKIGAVGQTGRATGPHLHFSIYVNQVATNPREWFSHSF